MAKITVYASKHCGTCAQVVPIIKQLAKKKKISVKVIDVDKCHTKECDDVRWTPSIRLNNKEISLQELARVLSPEAKK